MYLYIESGSLPGKSSWHVISNTSGAFRKRGGKWVRRKWQQAGAAAKWTQAAAKVTAYDIAKWARNKAAAAAERHHAKRYGPVYGQEPLGGTWAPGFPPGHPWDVDWSDYEGIMGPREQSV